MLDCGTYYNEWVQHALSYLPEAMLAEHKDGLVFISTAQRDGCRMARGYCDTREVILLSERILPKHGAEEGQPEVRYFIYVVLHEVAHAIISRCDGIAPLEAVVADLCSSFPGGG